MIIALDNTQVLSRLWAVSETYAIEMASSFMIGSKGWVVGLNTSRINLGGGARMRLFRQPRPRILVMSLNPLSTKLKVE